MGIFFEITLHPDVEGAIRDQLGDDRRSADNLVRQLEATGGQPMRQTLQWKRLLVAVGILAALIAAAIGTEAADLDSSSEALWGLTASTLGLIVGLVGGEKASS